MFGRYIEAVERARALVKMAEQPGANFAPFPPNEVLSIARALVKADDDWNRLRWCSAGCKEDSGQGHQGYGFGGTDPFGLGW